MAVKYALTPSACNALARMLRGKMAVDSRGANAPRPVSPDAYPAPFTVRWSASASSAAGAWVIWLPSLASLVYFNASAVSITGVTACQELPAGWYTIDDLQASSSAVYLVVTFTDATGAATAEVSMAAGSASSGETVYNIQLAALAYDSATGARSVRQYADSVITLGGEGGGFTPDDVSTDLIPDPPSGTQPDGDEGKLQIKGFKAGAPADQNTVTDYLQGVVNIPNGGIHIVCRGVDNGARTLFYLPLSALFSSSSISGNVSLSYLADLQWNTSTHTLQKKVNTVNLKTGAVTQGNWQTITNGNTTPISSIIGS